MSSSLPEFFDPLYHLAPRPDFSDSDLLTSSDNARPRPALSVHISKGPAGSARGAQNEDVFFGLLNSASSLIYAVEIEHGCEQHKPAD